MLATISAVLGIADKAPAAIDYFYMRPHPQWVPDAALKKAHQNRAFWLSVVALNNLSTKVLSPIRIKLPFNPQYEPVIDHPNAAAAGLQYDAQAHEVRVGKLDPGEDLYVAVFLSKEEADRFQEPCVIVGDRLLSRGMRTVGFFKNHPKVAMLYTGWVLLMASALAGAGYAIYTSSSFNPQVRAIEEATAGLSGCVMKAYANAQVNETLLARHMLGDEMLLQLNHVVTRKDLFGKDQVVICEAP